MKWAEENWVVLKMGRRKKGSNIKKAEEKWAVGKMGIEIGF